MDVLVAGGGIVGCAVSVACARRGMRVLLVDRGPLASGASSLDLALLGTPVPPALEGIARVAEEHYLKSHHFTGRAFLLDRSPIECEGLPGASVRRIDPRGAALALAEEARAYRAEVRTGIEVKSLLLHGNSVRGLRTDTGELRAGTTVVAAGAETWRLCRELPQHLPLETVEGFTATYAPGVLRELDGPHWKDGAWAARDGGGRVVVSEPERLVKTFPGLLGLEPLERRSLRYATTADGLPLQGPVEGIRGVTLACGYGRHGIALAPGAAEAVADAIAGGEWTPEFLPGRFS